MGAYVARRLIQSVFVILSVVILVFILARLTGDPATLYLPLEAREELRVAFRIKHGLDQPIPVQLGQYLWNVAHLDFGESLWQKQPAMPVVLSRLPLTLQLATVTTLVSFIIAFVLGTLAAVRPLSIFDRATVALSLLGMTVPQFWLGLMLILIFAVRLNLVPTSGTGGLAHVVLPGITLSWPAVGSMAQIVRTSVLEQLSAPYTVTARAKGLKERAVLFRHIARNALIPPITVAGQTFIGIANGAVIVETVFGWPGIGKLMIDAIERRDFAIAQAVVFVVALMVVVLNLLLDFCYAAIDPRIRYD